MLNSGGVYTIMNTLNGKRYVGSAKCFRSRKGKHLSALSLGKHHTRHLQAAVDIYGLDVFEFVPILLCAPEDLVFYEQRAIDVLKPEYNSSPTAGNTLGVKCGPRRRQKISDAHKGKTLSKEHRAAIAAGGMGRRPSEETRVKLIAAAQARAADPEWVRKVSEGKKGKPMSEAHKASLSVAKKGKPANLSEESRLLKNSKIAEANRTRPISDSMRANMRLGGENKKGAPRFEYKGQEYTLLQLSRISGLGKVTLRYRLQKLHWSVADAVETPSRKAE